MSMSKTYVRSQRGMTFWMLLVVLALIGFFAKTAIIVYPMVYNQYKVEAHLAQVAADPETAKMDPKEIVSQLMKRFDQVDSVEGIGPKNIKVTRDERSNKLTIAVDYELRKQFYGPFWIVGNYSDTKVEVKSR